MGDYSMTSTSLEIRGELPEAEELVKSSWSTLYCKNVYSGEVVAVCQIGDRPDKYHIYKAGSYVGSGTREDCVGRFIQLVTIP
jgi:hypothetical protein